MKSEAILPQGYTPLLHIDLKQDKKLMLLVNGLAILIMLALAALGLVLVPFESIYIRADAGMLLWKLGVLTLGSFVYIIAHELVHGVFMKWFSGQKVQYGFTGMYAYAGSSAYFCKQHYIIIALAPIVIWGVVLAILTAVVPESWFWPVYFIQISNLSGAAGDLYVCARFAKMPEDILVQDSGVAMTVYTKQQEEQV